MSKWLLLIVALVGCDDGSGSVPILVVLPDMVECTDACSAVGDNQCDADGQQTCVLIEGCKAWSAATPCPSGQLCADGRCQRQCRDACAPGARRCTEDGTAMCQDIDGDGCFTWSAATACADGTQCEDGTCACVHECAEAGARECYGFSFRVCIESAAGCRAWDTPQVCPGDQRCEDAVCVGCVGTNACSAGQVECLGNGVRRCGAPDAAECRRWGPVEACAHGQRCAAGQCVGPVCAPAEHNCDDQCVASNAVATCGERCRPCPQPDNARAVCADSMCDLVCDPGTHRCGEDCLFDERPQSCGDRCAPCAAPANAVAVCTDGACDFNCQVGTHRCDASCVLDDAPEHCGDRCVACPAPDGTAAICVEGRCDVRCLRGFMRVDDMCVACPAAPDGTPACPNSWSEVTRIGSGLGVEADTPQVLLTADGRVMTVWVQGRLGVREVRARIYDPVTGVWARGESLNHGAFLDAREPQFTARSDGSVVLVWAEGSEDDLGLYSRRWDPQTDRWSRSRNIRHFGFDHARTPALMTTPQGTVWLAWAEGDVDNHQLYGRALQPEGDDWDDEIDLSDRRFDDVRTPALAADAAGNVYLAWAEGDADAAGVRARRLDAATGIWSEPERLSHFELDVARAPDMAVTADGDVWLAWTEFDRGDAVLFVRRWRAVEQVWEPEVDLSQFRLDEARHPQIIVTPDGDVVLAWTEFDGADAGLFVRRLSRGAVDWSEPLRLSDFALDEARTPQLAADALSNVHLVWAEGDADEHGIESRRYDAALRTWSEPEELTSFRLDDALDPQIAVASNGQAFLVWSEGNPGDRQIMFRRYWP